MESDFEAFRRDRNYRRRQVQGTERPAGHAEVWTQIEERERHELKERQINAEVEEFFADATRLAANIVKKVSESHKQEITDKLRREMEEFLFESIRHATNMIMSLGEDHGGEQIIETSVRNLKSALLDDFRAAGTAQLADKHLGVDPFSVELQAVAEEVERQHANDSSEPLELSPEHIRLTDSELSLEIPAEPQVEREYESDELDAVEEPRHVGADQEPEEASDEARSREDDELPLAALYHEPVEEAESAEEAEPVAAGAELDPKVDAKVRAALALLVRYEALSKDDARTIYRRFRG